MLCFHLLRLWNADLSRITNKMIKKSIFFFLLISCSFTVFGQNKYWVVFTDKKNVHFDPLAYFDAKAIERRVMQGIPLCDSTDYPVNTEYLESVSKIVDSVSYNTRWLNALAVYATTEQIQLVQRFYFVKEIIPMEYYVSLASAGGEYNTIITEEQQKVLIRQTERMGCSAFVKNNMDGKGMRIAIFDAGFPTVDVNPAFEHIRKEGRILKTWDFTKNKEFVYSYNTHGLMTFSCTAGMVNGQKIGLATGAEFILARTEVNSEPFSEEENWLAAVEWADKNGANIINSSLGYTKERYFPWDMDGKKSFVTRAANIAAKKGILVVNAAGNEGANNWKYMGAPADADSALSIGGIAPETDFHTSFSSYGPTADKRMKPNVCAFGHVVAAGKSGLESTQGTSFASPLVAGFAACAWQTNRSLKNMELFHEIEKSGDLYPYFDYAHGFGIPQSSYFLEKNKKENAATFRIINENGSLRIVVYDECLKSDSSELNDMTNNLLYYHIENELGYLDEYYVIEVKEKQVAEISATKLKKGYKLRVHFKGYSETFQNKD